MMSSNELFVDVHHFFSRRRLILLVAALAAILISVAAFFNINLDEDIRSMLPDDTSEAASSFKLLQQAPFTRKLIINLNANQGTSSSELIEIADRLAQAMTAPFFSHVVTGPGEYSGAKIFGWLLDAQPNLITEQDLKEIRHSLTDESVRRQLSEIYSKLLSAEGSAMKGIFQQDPLAHSFLVLEKLRYLRMIPSVRLENGHFMSSDGKSALIIADTPFEITDSFHALKMLNHFQRLIADLVPDSIDVSFISGHRYTVANAETIKRDVGVILLCSSAAIFIIFLIFLRSWGGFFVFLIPVSVLCIAAGSMAILFETVSAVTIGFGAVLLGISVDFALHVYFPLRSTTVNPAKSVGQVSRPIMFSALTTMGAFGVLLFSSLPVQREFAIFSIIGIGAAVLLSLIVLPHVIRTGEHAGDGSRMRTLSVPSPSSKWVICGWLLLISVCAWQATRLQFNGDLRALNLVPDEIRVAEKKLKQTWGNFRGRAVIFTEGSNLQTALEANDRLFRYLSRNMASDQIVSLAPILPSLTTQQRNRQRWQEYWSEERKTQARQKLTAQGQPMGFTQTAFEPFFERLSRPSAPITVEKMRALGFGEILDALILHSGKKIHVVTLVPDIPEVAALFNQGNSNLSGVRFVSQRHFAKIISKAIADDFIHFIIKSALVVCLLLGLLFRNLKMVLVALIPVVTGMVFMMGVMGALDIAFNLFNIVAAILVIGLGVDYGIFMVHKIQNNADRHTGRAVFVSGLTTLAGFGALVVARHPALHSIGLTVLLGISVAMPAALWVIPAVYRKR